MRFFRKRNKNGEKDGEVRYIGRFASGIAEFFDPQPEKEKILRHEDFHGAGDEYYAVVSSRYKVAQRIFAVLCVVFLLFSVFTNISSITYENLFYFAREFGSAVDMASVDHESLSYDVYKDQTFTFYRGGIAAVSPSNVSLYTATGRRTYKGRASFVAPFSVASRKYLLAYDVSGNSFSLYNSFSKVYTESLEYPVTDAAVSDSGAFAVVTRTSEFKTLIKVYNNKIKLAGNYYKNDYCFDVALDQSGEKMAALFYEVRDGRGAAILRVYDISDHGRPNKDETEARLLLEKTYGGVFPLGCAFLENGKLVFVTDGSVSVFDRFYEEVESVEFREEISAFSADLNGAAVALRSGALSDLNRVVAFNADGKLIYDDKVRSSIDEISVYGDYVFAHSAQSVLRIDTSSDEIDRQDSQSGKMFVYDGETAIVCGASSAVYIKFQKD